MLALITRVKNLLLTPGAEWEVIDREDIAPRRLALRYVAPLAAIPALAIIIALAIVGVQVGGEWYRAPWLSVVLSALVFYLLSIAGVFAFAWLINVLAPRFSAAKNYRQAFKLAAYSTTAAMVAGIIAISPALQIFALMAATYSLYLLFIGTPKVMHPAPKSAVNYAIATTFSALIIATLVGLAAMLVAAPTGNPFPQLPRLPFLEAPETPRAPAAPSGSAGALGPGAPGSIIAGDLRGAVPETLVGLNRVAVGVERSGQAGQRTINLEAEYRASGRSLTLQIVYSPSIAQVIGFGGVSTSEFDRQTPDGYSRRRRVDTSIIVEDWNEASQAGSYGRLAEDRFYVRATGRGVRPEDLRSAVELFGQETLAQFAAGS